MYAKELFHRRKQHRSRDGRHLEVDPSRTRPLVDERTGIPYVGNGIRSNKYTLWTFIPRQLLAQFSKLANFYFLCFAIMQLIPGLSTIGTSTNIIPLMAFISISMAKEGFDDYRRHQLDKKENRRETPIIDRGAPLVAGALNWQPAQWRDLRVGVIIKLKRDEPVPADIVLLSSSNLGESNIVYVETIALDGESNLKGKQAVKVVAKACATAEKLRACSIEFVTEDPNADLSTFTGKVRVDDKTSPLTNENIIYRGSVLRNVSQVTAMIVYSGEECKIRMNASGNGYARTKAPHMQSVLNRIVVLVVFIVVGLSVYNTLAYQGWKSKVEIKLSYLSSAAVPFHQEFFGFVIMFATMVPLSLYVSMEMIKLAQIFFLNSDVDMYEQRSNTPFEARTSTINEDLGQVTHIFSDKTGTLTDNEMRLRKLFVAGAEWTHDDAEGPSQDIFRAGSPSYRSPSTRRSSTQPAADRNTRELVNYLSQRPDSAFAQQAKLMLRCMALCHSCIPETTQNGMTIDFQASSPDELALVRAARDMGFLMRSRDHEAVVLALSSPSSTSISTETYEVLNLIDFSSDRRRMSVIVRFPDGRICLICKGADSVIMERLRLKLPRVDMQNGASSQRRDGFNDWSTSRDTGIAPRTEDTVPHPPDTLRMFAFLNPRRSMAGGGKEASLLDEFLVKDSSSVMENCIRSVNKFASESLRTLLYVYRFLDEKEYAEWRQIWDAAATSLSNRGMMIEKAAELLEVNFELAGATAIEDKLQEGVVETIDKLSRANIKIWMLTGDKRETAINIGHSCGLIKAHSIKFNLNVEGGGDLVGRVRSTISTLGWTAMAVAEAMIIYFCMLTLFANAAITKDNTLFSMGDLSFVAVVIVISMKLQIIEMHNKSIVAGLSVFISTGAVFLWNILLAAVYPPTSIYKARGGFFNGFGQNPTWWMTLIFIVACVYVLEFSVAAFRKTFFPTDTDVFQELERDQAYKERFEAAAVRHGWERYSDELVDARKGSDIQLTVLRRWTIALRSLWSPLDLYMTRPCVHSDLYLTSLLFSSFFLCFRSYF
jgi:phospholipid-translocating ATPase